MWGPRGCRRRRRCISSPPCERHKRLADSRCSLCNFFFLFFRSSSPPPFTTHVTVHDLPKRSPDQRTRFLIYRVPHGRSVGSRDPARYNDKCSRARVQKVTVPIMSAYDWDPLVSHQQHQQQQQQQRFILSPQPPEVKGKCTTVVLPVPRENGSQPHLRWFENRYCCCFSGIYHRAISYTDIEGKERGSFRAFLFNPVSYRTVAPEKKVVTRFPFRSIFGSSVRPIHVNTV